MAGHFKFTAFALALGVGATAFGTVQLTEHFDDDPITRGWSGVGNRGTPQNDYGFSTTDNTGNAINPPGGTATGAGEAGGKINRGPDTFYGVDLGGAVNFATTDMNVKGVLNETARGSSTTLNLGWSQGITTVIGDGSGNAGTGVFMSWDDGNNGSNGMKVRGANFGIASATGPSLITGGPTVPFEMDWNSGTRTFTMNIDGNIGTVVVAAGDVGDIGLLDHWGMWGRTTSSPDNANFLWIDDITFKAASAVPEPASLGLISLGAVGFLRRRRRS